MKLIVASHNFAKAPKVYIVKPVSRGTWAQRTPVCCGKHFVSFSSLSYDRSKASCKASSPHSAIQSFLFQMKVSSPFLKVIQQLPTSSSSSFCHFYPPFYLSFSNLLQKTVSTQNVTNPVRLPFTCNAVSLILQRNFQFRMFIETHSYTTNTQVSQLNTFRLFNQNHETFTLPRAVQ